MRNLLEYPITKGEIIACLNEMSNEMAQDAVGDMRPLLLRAAADFIAQTMPDDFEEVQPLSGG